MVLNFANFDKLLYLASSIISDQALFPKIPNLFAKSGWFFIKFVVRSSDKLTEIEMEKEVTRVRENFFEKSHVSRFTFK